MVKILRVIGIVLVVLAVLFIVGNMALILWFQGWDRFQDIFSPFNIWNNIMVLLTIAPGAFFMWLSDKIDSRKKSLETRTSPENP